MILEKYFKKVIIQPVNYTYTFTMSAIASFSAASVSSSTPMGPDSFLERLSSIVHLNQKQREQIESAYFESLATSYQESHCHHEIKVKEGGKKSCNRELINGMCPIHKLNIYAPVTVAKKMCTFPGAKACPRNATDGSTFCSFHKDKTPEDKKTLCCKFVFQAGEHKGETCSAKFSDYSKYQAPGQLPELARPDNYKDMSKAEQLEWEENTSDLVREFFAEMRTSPEQYLGQYMNEYCPTHYIDVITKEIKKDTNFKYDAKAKNFVEKAEKKSKKKSDEEKEKPKEKKSVKEKKSDEEKPKEKKSVKEKKSAEEKPKKKPVVLDDDDSDDESDSKESLPVYPVLNFSFPTEWSTPAYVGAKVDGQSGYCRAMWRDAEGRKSRAPILIEASKIDDDILEMVGYTEVEDRAQLVSSEVVREYHPIMDEFIALMKRYEPETKVYVSEQIKDKI